MATIEKVIKELDNVPAEHYDILIRFISTLKNRPMDSAVETALMSESALAVDWLNPDEDKAWADL